MTHSTSRALLAVFVRHVRASLGAQGPNFAILVVQTVTALIADAAIERGVNLSTEGRRFRGETSLLAFLATASRGGAAITIVYRLYGER